MFLHGGAAHADWWSFIAPFFAKDYRVVASTFTGMGRSDWREHYVFEQFLREAREAGRAGGAFDGGKPVVVGHSFGGRAAMGLSRDFGPELKGAVMVDPPFFAPQNLRPPSPPRPSRARRVQHSLAGVVTRFRLMPPSPATTSSSSITSRALPPVRPSTSMAGRASRCRSIRISGRNSPASTRFRSSRPRIARWR